MNQWSILHTFSSIYSMKTDAKWSKLQWLGEHFMSWQWHRAWSHCTQMGAKMKQWQKWALNQIGM